MANQQHFKVDLHVHSRMSDRPSHWILQKLSCPETFTPPLKVYQVAKQRGMDLVTITDHNTINGKDLSVITCHPNADAGGAVNFKPVGDYQPAEYPEIRLYYPPFLKMLDFCFGHNITRIHTATPGPVGLCGLAIARTLNLPVDGTYHTAFPQYAADLTGDNYIGDLMWKAMIWFYSQMNLVFVLSKGTGSELAARGLSKDKIRVYPRGMDIQRFHPGKRNGFWQSAYGPDNRSTKLL